jgi:hypothetical protein
VGNHPNVTNYTLLDSQEDLHGIPALAHCDALAARIIKRADILRLSGQAKEPLTGLAIQGKSISGHISLSSPASTGKFRGKLLQLSFEEGIHSLSHGCCGSAVEDGDSNLLEAHEGAHAHTAGNEYLNSVLGQVGDGGHASALLVRDVGQGADIFELSVRHFHNGIYIAVTKMGAKG